MTVPMRIVFVLFLFILAVITIRSEPTATYNCALAEISPDFTPAMKLKCRDYK